VTPKLSREEQDRLEGILCAVEASLSDWGMSAHRADGVLDRFREAQHAGREGCAFSGLSRLPQLCVRAARVGEWA
jgi:hypothetical protein